MALEEDFIIRVARRMGEVLARALGLGKAGQYEESLQALEEGVSSELGLTFSILLRLEPASAVRLLGKPKARLFAEALRTRALLFELAKRHDDAKAAEQHAEAVQRACE